MVWYVYDMSLTHVIIYHTHTGTRVKIMCYLRTYVMLWHVMPCHVGLWYRKLGCVVTVVLCVDVPSGFDEVHKRIREKLGAWKPGNIRQN